jgi:hypothetical protein
MKQKGVAFDEGVNMIIFAMAVIFLGILFAISGVDITTLLSTGTGFALNVAQGLSGLIGKLLSGM